MNWQKFFLLLSVFFVGCQNQEEEGVDLDQMVQVPDEREERHLAVEPPENPQEILIQESPSFDHRVR